MLTALCTRRRASHPTVAAGQKAEHETKTVGTSIEEAASETVLRAKLNFH